MPPLRRIVRSTQPGGFCSIGDTFRAGHDRHEAGGIRRHVPPAALPGLCILLRSLRRHAFADIHVEPRARLDANPQAAIAYAHFRYVRSLLCGRSALLPVAPHRRHLHHHANRSWPNSIAITDANVHGTNLRAAVATRRRPGGNPERRSFATSHISNSTLRYDPVPDPIASRRRCCLQVLVRLRSLRSLRSR